MPERAAMNPGNRAAFLSAVSHRRRPFGFSFCGMSEIDVDEIRSAMANPGWVQRENWQDLSWSNASAVYRQRFILMQRHKGLCHWCGSECLFYGNPNTDLFATRDHLIRLADGGADNLANMVLACRKCNNTRHGQGWSPNKK